MVSSIFPLEDAFTITSEARVDHSFLRSRGWSSHIVLEIMLMKNWIRWQGLSILKCFASRIFLTSYSKNFLCSDVAKEEKKTAAVVNKMRIHILQGKLILWVSEWTTPNITPASVSTHATILFSAISFVLFSDLHLLSIIYELASR